MINKIDLIDQTLSLSLSLSPPFKLPRGTYIGDFQYWKSWWKIGWVYVSYLKINESLSYINIYIFSIECDKNEHFQLRILPIWYWNLDQRYVYTILTDWVLYKYWLHERVTWEKSNVDRGKAEVDIGFWGLTISHVTLSCSQ